MGSHATGLKYFHLKWYNHITERLENVGKFCSCPDHSNKENSVILIDFL